MSDTINKTRENGTLGNPPEVTTPLSSNESETPNKALFTKSEYSNNKVSIEVDSDVFELARCLCFVVPMVSPTDLLENVLRKGLVEVCTPYIKEIKSIFKRNPYDKLSKYIKKGGTQ